MVNASETIADSGGSVHQGLQGGVLAPPPRPLTVRKQRALLSVSWCAEEISKRRVVL